VTFTTHYLDHNPASVLLKMGHTWVLCTASVAEEVPRWLKGQAQGWVTAEYGMLPGSTHSRTPREATVGRVRSRTQEIQRLIGRSLRASVDLAKVGERTVTIDCDVLQADGGTRTAAITGGYAALVLALRPLIAAGQVRRDIWRGAVAAVSVGVVQDELLLDLCYREDSQAQIDMNVVMNARGHYVEVQGTAEGRTCGRATLDSLLNLAETGIQDLLAMQRTVLDQ
jgi:ribonuclease PH